MYTYEKQHTRKVKKLAPECTLFLKTDGSFPLEAPGKIAVYGNGARYTVMGGTGSGEVNTRFVVSIEKALEHAGFELTTKNWLDAYDECRKSAKKAFVADVQAEAKKTHQNAIVLGMGKVMPEPEYVLPMEGEGDTAIYVLSRISGEGNDRKTEKGDVLLTDTEVRDILKAAKLYAKFMLVLNVGGPVDLSPVKSVPNILLLSQLGSMTGFVLADILLGKSNPSGKLATTWAKAEDYCRIGEFGEQDDTHYNEGVYVGYRYFDSVGKEADFPFGFGLSYTTFETEPGKAALDGEEVTLPVFVTNTGKLAGKEVVELYVSSPEGEIDKPYQQLAAYGKSAELQPEETKIVNLTFKMSSLASYDTLKAAYVLEQGDYVLRVGSDSVHTVPCAVVSVPQTLTVRKVKNLLGDCGFEDWKPENPVSAGEVPVDLPVLALDPAAIVTEEVAYPEETEVSEEVRTLSEEQVLHMVMGSFNEKGGALSVIGNAAQTVAGAAGESYGGLEDVPPLVMADGPAGLRLARQYFIDKDGNAVSLNAGLPESMIDFASGWMSSLMKLTQKKPKKGQEIRDQYCNSIPIGTALAQSFNDEIVEQLADIVGAEMERFGVDLWLAPAMNIHRDIRCGRNFEYYSEDPLLTGRMAAAITRGVQAHDGRGVTIKHFCANNQETNRYRSNSLVSERAMREIYLKGFEICIREAQPKALMSSYNLLNGAHTSESKALNVDVLRHEMGYKGIIMTDWVVSLVGGTGKYENAHSEAVVAAGTDLFMPGSKSDYNRLAKAAKENPAIVERARVSATRLLKNVRALKAAQSAIKE